jgi:hypothetical protein
MLQSLLGHNTHHRLRIQAFALLLKWTNVHMIDDEDWTGLYRNAIPWIVFQDEIIATSEASAHLRVMIEEQSQLGIKFCSQYDRILIRMTGSI